MQKQSAYLTDNSQKMIVDTQDPIVKNAASDLTRSWPETSYLYLVTRH